MTSIKNIYPECDADTLFVELMFQRGKPSHYKGINNVGKILVGLDSNKFIIGIVDTDKFKIADKNIELFSEVVEDKLSSEGLLIKKMPDTNKHVIRIHPEFEPWIWNQAKQADLHHHDFNIKNYDAFEGASKRLGTLVDKDVKKFINAVITANPPAIQTMRKWLEKAI